MRRLVGGIRRGGVRLGLRLCWFEGWGKSSAFHGGFMGFTARDYNGGFLSMRLVVWFLKPAFDFRRLGAMVLGDCDRSVASRLNIYLHIVYKAGDRVACPRPRVYSREDQARMVEGRKA